MPYDDIIPSIISEVPSEKITLTYPTNLSVDLGTKLAPHQVRQAPEAKWDAHPEKFYTLYMFDPDAISRRFNFLSDIVHWLVINIKGCDLNSGELITEYMGSGAPRWSGFHRYIFLLFEHDEKIEFEGGPITSRMGRLRFSTKLFRDKYGFDKVFAWNYFNAEWCPDPQQSRTCNII